MAFDALRRRPFYSGSHVASVDFLSFTEQSAMKKILDAMSIASLAVVVGVVVWSVIWGETPHTAGHLSIQSKIVAWDTAPGALGLSWLIVRYAEAAAHRFPRVFGPRGLLYYLAVILFICVLVVRMVHIVRTVILPKLGAGVGTVTNIITGAGAADILLTERGGALGNANADTADTAPPLIAMLVLPKDIVTETTLTPGRRAVVSRR